ncbi:DUF397 domain-containing protein [Streptomyces zagrosensis]|uniref:DUF397 domain-containing protein n=1 Tax=Streptomyces zagrosensis TaxID=1042984 RepID=A0A7W9UYT2_9ACTN|nr:DUF397 domain-containing protein [Streptomyces zagrosensis]MBB5936285.1 hypothetical protein [Streptomyces zagrosensis]
MSEKWSKSSYSGSNGGQCVEICTQSKRTCVRDSKDQEGSALSFDASAWSSFVAGVKAGEFAI